MKRIFSILQLCLGFGALLWILCYPFMGALYFYKSELLLYEHVMGKEGILGTLSKEKQADLSSKLAHNATLFATLSEEEKSPILVRYDRLQKLIAESFSSKLKKWVEVPIFEFAWIILAITLPILLLLKTDGAQKVVWLLPVITACYALDNIANGQQLLSEKNFFPDEKTILQEPLASSLSAQRQQLEKAWQIYLIEKWAKESPSTDPIIFQEQAERGEFAFNLGRLKVRKPLTYSVHFRERKQPGVLALFWAWNLFFAVVMQLRDKRKSLLDSQAVPEG